MPRSVLRLWRWAALPFGLLYLVLLVLQFRSVIAATYLDADAVSAPVIGELFGSAPAQANVVLGEFGWYATLLFELATKWLPLHLSVWVLAPYAMALVGAALAAWSVWQVAGRWAASLTAVLLVCAAPSTLHLLLSSTQHAPDWFCLALLAAFVVLLERRSVSLRRSVLVALALLVGSITGVNAASDPLVVISGVAPFALTLLTAYALARSPDSIRGLKFGLVTLAATAVFWVITLVAMSALNVAPQPGLNTTMLAAVDKIGENFRLWWHSIAVLGNGDFFGHELSFASGLAVACAVLSIGAIVLLPAVGGRALRVQAAARGRPTVPGRFAFVVFWCSSAGLLTGAFLLSATPVDIHADRYLVGLLYAGAAVIPAVAAGRPLSEAAALAGTCIFALGGVVSLAQGTVAQNAEGFLPARVHDQIARIAAGHHLRLGYAGYWDAAPITWATRFRVHVYPVSVCDQNAHLCRFDLHFISSWYTPRARVGSFLLADSSPANVPAPTPDLGTPTAVYHVGRAAMYIYPYDLATKIVP